MCRTEYLKSLNIDHIIACYIKKFKYLFQIMLSKNVLSQWPKFYFIFLSQLLRSQIVFWDNPPFGNNPVREYVFVIFHPGNSCAFYATQRGINTCVTYFLEAVNILEGLSFESEMRYLFFVKLGESRTTILRALRMVKRQWRISEGFSSFVLCKKIIRNCKFC